MSAPTPSPAKNNGPRASAWVGFFLTLVGFAMIFYVFQTANGLLAAPPPTVPKVVGTDPNGATNAGLALGQSMTTLLQKLLVLLVMCVAGSVLSSQGIKMMFNAWNAQAEAPVPQPD